PTAADEPRSGRARPLADGRPHRRATHRRAGTRTRARRRRAAVPEARRTRSGEARVAPRTAACDGRQCGEWRGARGGARLVISASPLLFVALLGLAAAPPQQGAIDPQQDAFIELVAERSTAFEQQPTTVTLRFGFWREQLAQNLVPMFQQRLDLPIQLDAPWLDRLSGAFVRKAADGEGALDCVCNDGVAT